MSLFLYFLRLSFISIGCGNDNVGAFVKGLTWIKRNKKAINRAGMRLDTANAYLAAMSFNNCAPDYIQERIDEYLKNKEVPF